MSDTELRTAVDELQRTVVAFREANDANLKKHDAVHEDKIVRLSARLDAFEPLNQKLTLAAGRQDTLETAQTNVMAQLEELSKRANRPGAVEAKPEDEEAKGYRRAFREYCKLNDNYMADEDRRTLKGGSDRRNVLLGGNDALGGYYLAPGELEQSIIKAVIEQSNFRALASTVTISVPSWRQPKRTGTFAAKRVSELGTRSETTGYATGMVEIFSPELYAEVHISQQLLEDSIFNLESEMGLEFAEQFAVKEGAEFIGGTGAGEQAEGILTASGVVSQKTGLATTIQFDTFFDMFHKALKTAYTKNATWVFNRRTLAEIRKLKDGEGDYLWQSGSLLTGVPNTMLGLPYAEMPDMPDIGAGTFPVALGDFARAYKIIDRVGVSVLRDPFTVANAGQVLFRARKRVGGGVILGEAIAKMLVST